MPAQRLLVTVASGIGMGDAGAAGLFTGPGIPACEGATLGLELLLEGANEFGYEQSIYDGETQCME